MYFREARMGCFNLQNMSRQTNYKMDLYSHGSRATLDDLVHVSWQAHLDRLRSWPYARKQVCSKPSALSNVQRRWDHRWGRSTVLARSLAYTQKQKQPGAWYACPSVNVCIHTWCTCISLHYWSMYPHAVIYTHGHSSFVKCTYIHASICSCIYTYFCMAHVRLSHVTAHYFAQV